MAAVQRCVSPKKLGRRYLGFELSPEYVAYIEARLGKTEVGDPVDGPEDPIQSAPATANGKHRRPKRDVELERVVTAAYQDVGDGLPADHLLCDPDLNRRFISSCRQQGIRGNAHIWNRQLLQLRKAGRLPKSTQAPVRLSQHRLDEIGPASEIAWRLMAIDYRRTLDELFCSPDFASEFDRLARVYGPQERDVDPIDYRRAALAIRKRSRSSRVTATEVFGDWTRGHRSLDRQDLMEAVDSLARPGAFVLYSGSDPVFAGSASDISEWLRRIVDNPHWQALGLDSIGWTSCDESPVRRFALKSALVQATRPMLNCPLLWADSEFPLPAAAISSSSR